VVGRGRFNQAGSDRWSEARRDAPLPKTAEVVVVGGGILGAATAFALRRAGIHPVIVELGDSLANLTTANASANVRLAYGSAAERQLVEDGLAFYADFANRTGLPAEDAAIGYVGQGGLFATLARDGLNHLGRVAEQQAALGVRDISVVAGDDLRKDAPWLAEGVVAGLLRPRDGWVNGVLATLGLVRASGATVCLDTGVLGFTIENEQLVAVRTNRGDISTRRAIIATGPFASRTAGVLLPVTLVRRHRLTVPAHPLIPRDAPVTIDVDRGSYWRPTSDGALIGWPRERTGGPALSPVPPDPSFPEVVLRDPDGVQRVSPFWRTVAADQGRGAGTLVAGQYDLTPDGAPLIGELADRRGIWINAGYSGQGVLGAPVGSQLLVDLLLGRRDANDNPFRLDRFDEAGNQPVAEPTVLPGRR
jgi:sarcosine oxidase subunit beta